MDIAALQAQLMQNVSLAITKQAMAFQEHSSEQMMGILDAPQPTSGHLIDVSI